MPPSTPQSAFQLNEKFFFKTNYYSFEKVGRPGYWKSAVILCGMCERNRARAFKVTESRRMVGER